MIAGQLVCWGKIRKKDGSYWTELCCLVLNGKVPCKQYRFVVDDTVEKHKEMVSLVNEQMWGGGYSRKKC